MFANANLFSYVERTAVGLRMEPAAAKGFPQDGIVRFLQTLGKSGVSIRVANQAERRGANRKSRAMAPTDQHLPWASCRNQTSTTLGLASYDRRRSPLAQLWDEAHDRWLRGHLNGTKRTSHGPAVWSY